MTKRELKKISDGIRDAIRESKETRSDIARATGISRSMLSHFMSGEYGLKTESLDALGRYLGLEVVKRKGRS